MLVKSEYEAFSRFSADSNQSEFMYYPNKLTVAQSGLLDGQYVLELVGRNDPNEQSYPMRLSSICEYLRALSA